MPKYIPSLDANNAMTNYKRNMDTKNFQGAIEDIEAGLKAVQLCVDKLEYKEIKDAYTAFIDASKRTAKSLKAHKNPSAHISELNDLLRSGDKGLTQAVGNALDTQQDIMSEKDRKRQQGLGVGQFTQTQIRLNNLDKEIAKEKSQSAFKKVTSWLTKRVSREHPKKEGHSKEEATASKGPSEKPKLQESYKDNKPTEKATSPIQETPKSSQQSTGKGLETSTTRERSGATTHGKNPEASLDKPSSKPQISRSTVNLHKRMKEKNAHFAENAKSKSEQSKGSLPTR